MTANVSKNLSEQPLPQSLEAFRDWLTLRSKNICHRQLVCLQANPRAVRAYIELIGKQFADSLYVGNEATANKISDNISFSIEAKQYKKWLGRQINALIFDARLGINLNAMLATMGLIRHSGICVLILPVSKNESAKIHSSLPLSFGYTQTEDWFYQKFSNIISDEAFAYIKDNESRFPPSQFIENIEKTPTGGIQPSTEQQNIIEFFTQNIREKHTLIVMGARGRGKSTLLGLLHGSAISANLLVYICAPSKSHAEQFYRICNEHKRPEHKTTSQFVAPEDLAHINDEQAVLFIDEMASLPPNFLREAVKKNMPIVMTGTNTGYEGSAKGFVQRLLPTLLNEPTTSVHTLNKPFRWYQDDPLESLSNTLLANPLSSGLQQCANVNINVGVITESTDLTYYPLKKSQLVAEPSIYNQVFGLLSLSHYQTTPNDIVRMMDSPDHQIFVCTVKDANTILAVACVISEGISNDSALAKQISMGKRRVQGHMTPQTLAYYTFDPQYCDFKYYRISRITVAANARRQGIASQLISTIKSHAITKGINFLSTSFGLTKELYSFWQTNSFYVAKIGQRIDSASGSRSIMMLADVQDTLNYPNAYLQMRLFMDTSFLQHMNPLKQEELKIFENHIYMYPHEETLIYAKIICQYFVDKHVSFKQTAFAILYLAKNLKTAYSCGNYDQNKVHILLKACNALLQKNLPKLEKQTIENKLRITLNKYLAEN